MALWWLCGGFDLALGGFARLFEVRSSRFKVQGSVALNIADSCPVVFQADLKTGFCPALASSGPVCPGIALLLGHPLGHSTAAARLRSWRWGKTARKPAKLAC
jgi:hypothetical protein